MITIALILLLALVTNAEVLSHKLFITDDGYCVEFKATWNKGIIRAYLNYDAYPYNCTYEVGDESAYVYGVKVAYRIGSDWRCNDRSQNTEGASYNKPARCMFSGSTLSETAEMYDNALSSIREDYERAGTIPKVFLYMNGELVDNYQ